MQPTLNVSYFSDVLCVWAYTAQIKLVRSILAQYGVNRPVRALLKRSHDMTPKHLLILDLDE
jgi:hypothetical protein